MRFSRRPSLGFALNISRPDPNGLAAAEQDYAANKDSRERLGYQNTVVRVLDDAGSPVGDYWELLKSPAGSARPGNAARPRRGRGGLPGR